MARRKRIIGASRLKRKLKRMPDDITEEVRAVIFAEAHTLRADISAHAPSSDESAPLDWEGNPRPKLKDAYEVRISKDGLVARIGIMGKRLKNQFFFATFLEFGTKFITARPHVRPAWNRRRQHTRRQIRKATVRALRKTAQWKVSDG